jgi:enamine deaminase RidA (YjgF/YER057c/UK114 family)
MMSFELLNPKGLEPPVGYAHVAKITSGTMVHVAGQAPFDDQGRVVGKGDFVAQFTQVVRNLKTAIDAVGGRPDQYAVLTIYVTDLEAYWANKKPLGFAYKQVFGKYFPAITLVEVKRLYNPDCMVEISGIAVLD